MKRIFLFACDPGGANTIIPLVVPLREKGYHVRLFGKGVALERYALAGLAGNNIIDTIIEMMPENVEKFLQDESPDFLITGTSAEDFTERYLWRAAELLGIQSFAILDQWVNYGIRFSPWGLSKSTEYELSPSHPFLPSRIIVMDEFARKEMVLARILEPDHILPLGQPYFETFFRRREALLSSANLRRDFGIAADEFVVTFVSEPLSQDYGEDPDQGNFWGFTERTIFRHVRNAFVMAAERTGKKIRMIIKLHPRESRDNYDDLLGQASAGVTTHLDHVGDAMELIHISDLVCGMSSMMLTEAAAFGKPVVSVLIGLTRESPFILDRRGIIRSIRSEVELDERLNQVFLGKTSVPVLFEIERNPVRAIIEEMERMLV